MSNLESPPKKKSQSQRDRQIERERERQIAEYTRIMRERNVPIDPAAIDREAYQRAAENVLKASSFHDAAPNIDRRRPNE